MLSTFICSSTTALLLRVMISSIPVGTHQRPIRRLLLFPATSCICTRVLTHKYEGKCVDYYCTRTASKSYSLHVSCLLSLSLSQSGYRGQCIWTVNSARSVRHPENRASFVLNRTAQTRQSSLPWRDSFSSINHQPLVLVDRTTHACILCLPPNECFRVEDTIRILFHFIYTGSSLLAWVSHPLF